MGESCSCLRKGHDSGEMKLTEQRKKGEVTQLDKINMVVKI